MRKFQCLLFVLKGSYIFYYIVCVTIPLILVISRFLLLLSFCFYHLFANLMYKHHPNICIILCIFKFLIYNDHIVSEMYIDRCFLKDGCYSQQIISAKNSWFPITLRKERQKHKRFNTLTAKTTPNHSQTNVEYDSVFLNDRFCFTQT